jgi:uncharacterized RDD family membrane protein YckC
LLLQIEPTAQGKLRKAMILDEELVRKKRRITEVFHRKTVQRRERNEFGEWEYVEKDLVFRRPVESVSSWIRLTNFIIDYYVLQLFISFISGFLQPFSPPLLIAFMPIAGFMAHFIIGEFYCQKTLGKFITRTVVVDEYGEPPDFKAVLLRTLIRLIPFEVFSFFGADRGWHDRWTNTYVLRRSELENIRELLRNQEDEFVQI